MGLCGPGSGCTQPLSFHAVLSAEASIGKDCRNLQLPRLCKRIVELGGTCWGTPYLFTPPPPTPGKFVAETPSVPWNGSQTLEVSVAWVSDAWTSTERPQSPGLEWGWVPAERLPSRGQARRWSWSHVAYSPGRWCCDHGDDPTDLHRHSGSVVEPEPAGHACPYQDS